MKKLIRAAALLLALALALCHGRSRTSLLARAEQTQSGG